MPLLSIVVVTLNASSALRLTGESICCQDFDNFECIFVDGKSIDDTVIKLKEISASLSQKGITAELISEKDNGIYDAMNKGINLTRGKWLYFLNAGDCLWNSNTLSRVCAVLKTTSSEIVYGDIGIASKDATRCVDVRKAEPLKNIKTRMPFCHQASFIRSDLLKAGGYNCNYRIAADYEFFLSVYLDSRSFEYLDFPIAIFDRTGLSSTSCVQLAHEFRAIQLDNKVSSSGDIRGRLCYWKLLLESYYQDWKHKIKQTAKQK
ncbi:glycosyltransferase family 2 protein [Adlercreutzia sp. ZJ304]|uniref:glycosyltransferase family 2 protein n=1 Tax=Adlercreutzia sp. ZJ304 TaxID=2709791 RepID=UPI0013EDE150|nr:glycosyltransferase family 2 protein [Adlercreutzia sp. ZJ304]